LTAIGVIVVLAVKEPAHGLGAPACIVAVTWEYRSRVMRIWLWPSRSLTILG
jgi:hypothetical protein